jgi:hypothetical protein
MRNLIKKKILLMLLNSENKIISSNFELGVREMENQLIFSSHHQILIERVKSTPGLRVNAVEVQMKLHDIKNT